MTQTPEDERRAAALSGRHPRNCVLCFNIGDAHDYLPETETDVTNADTDEIDTDETDAKPILLREALNAGILALNTLLAPDATADEDMAWLDDNAEVAVAALCALRDLL